MSIDPYQEAGLGYEHEPTPIVPSGSDDNATGGETDGGKIILVLAMVALCLVAAGYVVAELMARGWSLQP